jgi:hypothetical protein
MQKLCEQEVTKSAVLRHADAIINALLAVLSVQSATVHEGAMLAAGACAYACGPQFAKYLPAFYPHLKSGLANHQAWQARAALFCLPCGLRSAHSARALLASQVVSWQSARAYWTWVSSALGCTAHCIT